MPAGGLEVGRVYTRVGATFDDSGFQRWERRLRGAKTEARGGVDARLGTHVDTSGFDRYHSAAQRVNRSHDDLIRGSGRVRTSLGTLFVGGASVAAGAVAFGALAAQVKTATAGFVDHERVVHQTEAVIKSTGGAAKVTTKHLDDLSDALERKTGVDGDVIQSGSNMLLTFTNIRNEAGKGNKIFDEATKTVLDMSVALGQDTSNSAIQLGKALNDPIKGVTALQRVGVTFTEKQKEQIKTLVDHGKTLDAQKLILHELNKEFGGSAAAQASPFKDLIVTFRQMQDAVGKLVLPALTAGGKALAKFFEGLQSGQGAGGAFRRALAVVGDSLRGVAKVAGQVFGYFGTLYADNQRNLGRLVAAFGSLVAPIRQAIGSVVKAFRSAFSGDSGIGESVRQIVKVLVGFVTIFETKIGVPIAKRIIPGIAQAFRGMAQIIKGILEVISGLLTLRFGRAWDGVKDIFSGAIKGVLGQVKAMTAPMRAAAAAVGGAVGKAFSSAWTGIEKTAAGFVNGIIDILNKIPGVNIGHVHWGGSGGGVKIHDRDPSSAPAGGDPAGRFYQGGKVTMPVAIMGEEAPEHPEWVIPTNPAYRQRAVGLWMMAAQELGIPGFAGGGRFSFGQLERLWIQAGGDRSRAAIMAHIAQAESGGDPSAHNPSGATGLWQILGNPFPGNAYDPLTNARMAVAKSGGGGNLHPWDASRGAWGKYAGGGGGLLSAIGGAISGAGSAISGAAGAAFGFTAKQLERLLPHLPGGLAGQVLGGAFKYAKNKAVHFIEDKVGGLLGLGGGGGESSTSGLVGQVVRAIAWAREHGWRGSVTSGFRSDAEQVRIWNSGIRPAAKPISLGGPGSNHSRGQAIDVSDPEGFRRAMAGAPPGSRLLGLVPSDPIHFSVSGHRRGGIRGLIGGALGGELLAGGVRGFRGGGKKAGRRHVPRPSITEGAKGYIRQMQPLFSDSNSDYTGALGRVEDLNTAYRIRERRYDLSVEELVDENGNVDAQAVKKRADELAGLGSVRARIIDALRAALAAVNRAIKSYQQTIRLLRASLSAAKGKDRAGVRALLTTYEERLGEWRGHRKELTGDLIPNARLDLAELMQERSGVLGTKADASAAGGGDLGGGDLGAFDLGPDDTLDQGDQGGIQTVEIPPSAEQIAEAAAQQFAAFKEAAASAFSEFGSNAVQAGVNPFATEVGLMAGLKHYGAAQDTAPRIQQDVHVTIADPSDTHTFTKAALHEATAALA